MLWALQNAMTEIHATFTVMYIKNGCETAITPNCSTVKCMLW